MFLIEVPGTPIGGEDARENAWVDRIVEENDLSEVTLRFRLETGRNVDLDNLVRPAMRALSKLGYYRKGFPELRSLSATKEFDESSGLTIESGSLPSPSLSLLEIQYDSLPPSDKTQDWLAAWSNTVECSWNRKPLIQPVWIAITARTSRSPVGLLKPIIDGLEPLLGRDPIGSSRFYPNDDLVHWLRINRADSGPILQMAAGIIE